MNIVSVAVGKQYELEVQRLTKAYPQTIVITERTPGVETSFELSILNGLATKCKFGLLVPEDLKGPILFCDADLYPVVENPLQYFKVKEDTDIAYVVYGGTWHFPPRLAFFQEAIKKTGKINSGFMYFRNIDICRDVCFKWHKEYLKRMNLHLLGIEKADLTGEYDEPSLVFVLNKENYNIEFLDPRWNVWPTSNVQPSEAFFVQNHLNGWNMYSHTRVLRTKLKKNKYNYIWH
jgi:hypothetical protein